eukprot:scaffold193753_cov49-Attheya_sp.AAC.1
MAAPPPPVATTTTTTTSHGRMSRNPSGGSTGTSNTCTALRVGSAVTTTRALPTQPPLLDPRQQPSSSVSAAAADVPPPTAFHSFSKSQPQKRPHQHPQQSQQQQQYPRGGRRGMQSKHSTYDRHSRYPRPHQKHPRPHQKRRPHQHHEQHDRQSRSQKEGLRDPREQQQQQHRVLLNHENCETDGVPNMPLHLKYHSRDPRLLVWAGNNHGIRHPDDGMDHEDAPPPRMRRKNHGSKGGSAMDASVDPSNHRRPPSNKPSGSVDVDSYHHRSGHTPNHTMGSSSFPNPNSRNHNHMNHRLRLNNSSQQLHDSRYNNNDMNPTKSASVKKTVVATSTTAVRPLRRLPQTKAPPTSKKIAVGASLFPTAPIIQPPPPPILESFVSFLSEPAGKTTKTMTGKKRPRNVIGNLLHHHHASSLVSTPAATIQNTVSDKNTKKGKRGNVPHPSTASLRPKMVLNQTNMDAKSEKKLERKRALKKAYKKRRRQKDRSPVRNQKEAIMDKPIMDKSKDGRGTKVPNIHRNVPPNRGTAVPSRSSGRMPFLGEDPSRVVVDLVGPSSHEDTPSENLEMPCSPEVIYVDPDTIACPTPDASKHRVRSRGTVRKQPS